jgi:hypothetical protein
MTLADILLFGVGWSGLLIAIVAAIARARRRRTPFEDTYEFPSERGL